MSRFQLSQAAHRASQQAISYLMQARSANPDCISLAAGFVDETTLPAELVHEAATAVLTPNTAGRSALQYGTTPGMDSLRAVFRHDLARLENNPDVERLLLDRFVLTAGSQQLLCLVSQALIDPGDICLVAAPTYFVYLSVLEGVGAEVVPVLSDKNGMCPDGLTQTLKTLQDQGKLHRVRLVYAVSYYDNPAGISIEADRRARLVEIVRQWSDDRPIIILEDTAYRELRYDGPVLPSLWSYDDSGESVILARTYSKSFSPGLRVGFGVLPEQLVKPVSDLKGNEDFGSPRLNQHLLAHVLQSGEYAAHVERVIRGYRSKRDAMLAAADDFFSSIPGVEWIRPDGGLYVWMTLPTDVTTGFDSPLFRYAVDVAKVIYVPGELSWPSAWPNRPRNHMRLSFGVQDAAGICEGMQRLAQAVKHILAAEPNSD